MKYRYETLESDSRYFLLAQDFLSALRLKGYAGLPFKIKKGNLEVISIPISAALEKDSPALEIEFCDLASGRTKIRAKIADNDEGRELWDFVMSLLNPMVDVGMVWGPGFSPKPKTETPPAPEYWKSWVHMEGANEADRALVFIWHVMTSDEAPQSRLDIVFNLTNKNKAGNGTAARLTELRKEYNPRGARIASNNKVRPVDLPNRSQANLEWREYEQSHPDEARGERKRFDKWLRKLDLQKGINPR